MKTFRNPKKRFWLAAAALIALLLGPPLLCSTVLVYREVSQNYDGICPGIMDIDPYPCDLGEFIARNTISPFALAAHLAIFGVWIIAVLGIIVALGLGWWLWRRRNS